ncbi:hypothetical protein SKAU_G00360750 [Synaphobranchus kaupii]|uniref:Reverse transcriptase n=1 Tax=Synaphobranchus kaupii TaxID=118154 RepID=A0A9Q1EI67_SYNKA|nr:hypothetical protein SKAU_G00360750 [Synaphobranchus kaupii]
MGKAILQQLSAGLSRIDASQLPGKHKVWCYHFTLYPRVMWPLKMSEVTSSAVSRMDAKANACIRKWLGLPRCFSATGLYRGNTLHLPLKSITLGYRQEKVKLVMELRESSDETVKDMHASVRSGRKWRAEEEVDKAMSRLQHQEVVGRVQTGRAGLGWGDPPCLWSRANKKERKDLVVSEITRMEQEEYRMKTVAQAQQGRWTMWEGVPGCKAALTQGRFRWRHDQVLRKLAGAVEGRRLEARQESATGNQQRIHFLKKGESADTISRRPAPTLLSPGVEWRMEVDLGRQLNFPGEICSTTLRPDIVLWAAEEKSVLLVELTVPWEEGVEAAHERKRAKYADLVAECREGGWSARLYPVEVGARGFVGGSTTCLLKDLGLRGRALSKATREIAEEVEKASFWLWMRRQYKTWGAGKS